MSLARLVIAGPTRSVILNALVEKRYCNVVLEIWLYRRHSLDIAGEGPCHTRYLQELGFPGNIHRRRADAVTR